MKAIAYQRYGSPEALQLIELPDPQPRMDEVLIKTSYASINPIDWKIGAGRMKAHFDFDFPLIVGRDLAGIVESVGDRVTQFSPGDRVFALLPRPGGAFAEFVSVPASNAAKAPQQISLKQSAALPLVALTCWQALIEAAGLTEGQSVFILAGAGGTGSLAIQLARAKGATVVTSCGPANLDYVAGLGASEVFDYSCDDVIGEIRERYPDGIDVVFSNVLGDLHEKAYGTLRESGTLVTIGEPLIPGLAERFGLREFDVVVRPDGDQLAEVARMVDGGDLQPPAISEFPMERCADAMRMSMDGHVRGKIVLRLE